MKSFINFAKPCRYQRVSVTLVIDIDYILPVKIPNGTAKPVIITWPHSSDRNKIQKTKRAYFNIESVNANCNANVERLVLLLQS